MIPTGPTTTVRGATGKILALAMLAATLAATLAAGIAQAAPSTFTVSNTDDTGAGSLRQAITDANSNSNPAERDTIEFEIPASDPGCVAATGVCEITPAAELPTVTQAVIIDGYSQAGASANTRATGNDAELKIELSGAGLGAALDAAGIRISGPNSVVKGLVINRWSGDGVRVAGPGTSGNRIEGNFVGTDASGTQALGNAAYGVQIGNAPNNVVGGTSPAARNLISGNDFNGVRLQGVEGTGTTGNRVQGNYIGTDKNGTADLGNSGDGVRIIEAPDNLVGGTAAGARNVISGNNANGVGFGGPGASGNRIEGNHIGTDASGREDLGNSVHGVFILTAPNNLVGGTTPGARNVISGNNADGVFVGNSDARGTRIEGNLIGVDASGRADLGNSESGVQVGDAPDIVVGGTTAASRNIISANGGDGVVVGGARARGNSILRNSFFSNAGLGVDLGDDGRTTNDPGDPDAGPNGLQNFPRISSAVASAGSTTIQGALNSTPNKTFTIRFFSSPEADPSGFGEGQTFVGQKNVTTNAEGNASFTFSATGGVGVGRAIAATATNTATRGTSEFSKAVEVRPAR